MGLPRKTCDRSAEATAVQLLADDSAATRLHRIHWRFWQSPLGQPAWARPALLAVTALATFFYAWGLGSDTIETFYAASARSMSQSWHDFFFGAFDPAGTITIDKLPGALWVQALSLRIFGFHLWALLLPQVVEGTLTVLVLFRTVRRIAGPLAGIVAAGAQAASPATVLLNRGNISDSLLILLLVLAADAATSAIESGRPARLVVSGIWVGLAFQAKMTQAWLVLPALGLAWMVAGPGGRQRRLRRDCAVALAVSLAVSLSWMTLVSLVPANDRPYVDGSRNNSEFSQVFVYNGVSRFSGTPGSLLSTEAPFFSALAKQGDVVAASTRDIPASWNRLLSGAFGRDLGWLLPPTVVGAASLLVLRRRRQLDDEVLAATLLWLCWLVLTLALFSISGYIRPYYLAALSPAMAAICGIALAQGLRGFQRGPFGVALALTGLGTLGYEGLLTSGAASSRVPMLVLCGVGAWVAVASLAVGSLGCRRTLRPKLGTAGLVLSLGAVGLIPMAVSTISVFQGLGPFDTPLQSLAATRSSHFAVEQLLTERRVYLREIGGLREVGASKGVPLPAEQAGLVQLACRPDLVRHRDLRDRRLHGAGHRPRGAADRRLRGRSPGADTRSARG